MTVEWQLFLTKKTANGGIVKITSIRRKCAQHAGILAIVFFNKGKVDVDDADKT